ncbi:MAG: DUF3299 domain-containing protein [Desulfovibrio sp.]|jgi:zinc transporter ZupT|nr:DUF3299 domain-containing protein [Desulfovibrio sp.]
MALLFPYSWPKCRCLAPVAALLILFAAASPAEAKNSPAAYEEITWEQLLPEAGRGEKFFGDLNMDALADNDPLAVKAMAGYLEKWKDAPPNQNMQDKYVKIYGFIVPLEWENSSTLKEFLLVPYFGACIHVPPPPQNQIILVDLDKPLEDVQSMDAVFVSGKITIENSSSDMGNSVYSIKADKVELYTGNTISNLISALCLTLFCGISVCFGTVFALASKKVNANFFTYGLSFSAGILLCLGISTILMKPALNTVCAFLASAAFMAIIVHALHKKNSEEHACRNMGHSGSFAALAIAAHNVPECFAVFSAAIAEPALGLALGGAMVAHSIPLGIAVACPARPGASGGKAPWAYALLAGPAPAVAAILLYLSMRSFFAPAKLEILFACAGGIMITIATRELLPAAARCSGSSAVFRGCCAGGLFMLVILVLLYS